MSETLELTTAMVWISALSSSIALISTIYSMMTGGVRKNAAAISAMEKRDEAQDLRLTSIEQRVTALPGVDAIHDVKIALADLRGDLRSMQAMQSGQVEIIKRIEVVVNRHEQHLLEGGR